MKVHEEPFDARQYWEQLLEAHPDIKGVGYPNRSSRFGELQYRQRKHQVELASALSRSRGWDRLCPAQRR